MNRIFVALPSLSLVLLAIALAGCTIAPTAAPGAAATTPQGNRVQERAMTGQTE